MQSFKLTISRSRKYVDKPVSEEAADRGRAKLNLLRVEAFSDRNEGVENPREVEGRRGATTCGIECWGKNGGNEGLSLTVWPGDDKEGDESVEVGRQGWGGLIQRPVSFVLLSKSILYPCSPAACGSNGGPSDLCIFFSDLPNSIFTVK